MTSRDNFPAKVKRSLAERAAHFCSNPRCLRLTAGPHSNSAKSLTTGHAAHIHAASSRGPRYDPNQSATQRKSISNGIWLCRECGDLVDKDTSAHSAETLLRWRADHEALVAEIRSKGYSASLTLLQSRANEPQIAKQLLDLFGSKRALWDAFDAEFPERVRLSLDRTREQLVEMRAGLAPSAQLDRVLEALQNTLLKFFQHVEHLDLRTLRCDCNDPDWSGFADALGVLRKSVGLQLHNLAIAYTLSPSEALQGIMPVSPFD